jgi:hypothetical protein
MIALLLALADTTAALPFREYEAEQLSTTGSLLGPDQRFGTIAAEASGRKAVRLDNDAQSIELTLDAPAQGITIRYAIADSLSGTGLSAGVQLWADDRRLATVPLTSRFSWYYGKYPFSHRPAGLNAHHFWDEVRIALPRLLASGTKLRLSAILNEKVRWIALDVVDVEELPPPTASPPDAIAITDFGADVTGRASSRQAFERAIATARRAGRQVYVPPGHYRVDGHLIVDRVTITGAGPWHSAIAGHGVGLYSRKGGSTGVAISGLAIESDVGERRDRLPLAAIGGTFSRSRFSDMLLHHAKVGVWLDGPAHGLVLRRLRITDQAADGINLHRGIVDAAVEDNFIRNVGDDGIASWSERIANTNVRIRRNRIIAPILANGIAIYGGRDIEVTDNEVADTLTEGGGIHLGARFHSTPFAGTIRIAGNRITRSGSMDPNWHFGVGSIWLYALEQPIQANIQITSNRIEDAPCEAMQLLGPHEISGVSIDGLQIKRSVAPVLALQARGSMSARAIVVEPAIPTPVDLPIHFSLIRRGGNEGWRTAAVSRAKPPACQ